MFRALFAHHQEALHTQQLVYFMRIMSAGCHQGGSGNGQVPTDAGQISARNM
jgi:hypothetical protein